MEWGCMQALIDFDGWRKWKDFSSSQATADDKPDKKTVAKRKKANRISVGSNGGGAASTSRLSIKEEDAEGGGVPA